MMEKRNFVTSARTPMGGASDIDDIIDSGVKAMNDIKKRGYDSFVKKASQRDEDSDASDASDKEM